MVKFRKRAEKKSILKKQDDSKVLPMPATRTRSQLVSLFTFTTEAETRDEEEILQPVATKSYDVEPQEDVHVAEGWNTDTNTDTDNTESMIHALRSKLGLNQCCVDEDDVDYDVLVESEGNKEEKPQQHEKIVMQTDGSLSFLIFSRFAVVEESTHLLIKIRALTFTPEDAKKCGGIGLTRAMLPYVPGQIVMGTIEGIGEDVDDVFQIGDRVIGMVEGGGCSRFLSAEADNFVKAPSNLGHSTSLALFQDWMPAYRGLQMAKNSLNAANLFGLNVMITDAMLPAGQAVVALALEDGANVFCCAQEKYQSYLESFSSRITYIGSEPEEWMSDFGGTMHVVVDNSCIDDYVSSSQALRSDKGVVIALPYTTFEDNRILGLFDMSSLQKQMKATTASMTMCKLIAVDTREEFKLNHDDDIGDEQRMNFVRDFQFLAYMHERGIIQPKISESVSLREVSRTHDKFKSGIVGDEGGTVVVFPWKSDDE